MSRFLQQWIIDREFSTAPQALSLELTGQGELRRPGSYLFVSIHSGDVWARRVVTENGVICQFFIIELPRCGEPQKNYDCPSGLLLQPIHYWGILTEVPQKVLIREFLIWYSYRAEQESS